MSLPFFKTGSRKIVLLLSGLILLTSNIFAQKWQNPSEKYLDAYKQYLNAPCPIPEDNIKHFVYFARDRRAIKGHPLLTHPRFAGAQVMYTWRELEPKMGEYDFSNIKTDIDCLAANGKKLFVQIQDATFMYKYKAVPEYLLEEEYDGGAAIQYYDSKKPEGWVAKRWNAKVRERFALFLAAMGAELDGQIEGINLQETSIGVSAETDPSFSEEAYVEGLKANMLALKQAFPTSATMIYANFMPGEWLPWEDKKYLSSLYAYGEEIGVGLGGPDLMVTRKGQLNHALKFMHEGEYSAPIGIAIQDGNYIAKTGADTDYDETVDKGGTDRKNLVPMLHAFARDFLKVDYMFWVDQEPYFEEDVLKCFEGE
ncbi:MAG: hypothetical protein AAFV07_19040 [Bacteroidota bacterium]